MEEDLFGASDDEGGEKKDKMADADFDVDDEDFGQLNNVIKKKEGKRKKSRKGEGKRASKRSKRGEDGEENPENATEEPELELEPEKPKEKSDIDEILDSLKKGQSRRRKPTKEKDEIDEMVRFYINKWETAADDDVRCNNSNQPAFQKVKLLDEFTTYLLKKYLQMYFLDMGILIVIRKWLEPLPDKSLPNLKVREGVFQVLQELAPLIHTDQLKESGLGKIVMTLYKHPQEKLEHKKILKTLIENWARPIFGLSAKYKDLKHDAEFTGDMRAAEEEEDYEIARSTSASSAADLEEELNRKRVTIKDTTSTHARIPDKIALDFKIMPKSKAAETEGSGKREKRSVEKHLNRPSKNLKGMMKNARALSVSIEGRNLPSMIQ